MSVYIKYYNELISRIAVEFDGKFAALASPTLSKQETVTGLYQSIKNNEHNGLSLSFPWRRLFEFVPRVMWMFIRISYAVLFFRVQHLPHGTVIFRTWLVPRSFNNSILLDDYFRQLPLQLSEHETVVTTFTSTDLSLLRQVRKIKRDGNQVISYGLLSLLDVIKLFVDYCFTALIQAKQKYSLLGKDVTAHINRSLLLDYLELRSFEAYAEKYKCKKLVYYKIKTFVYVFENQSWEKVCCSILSKHGIQLIGYQSSGFSPLFLNFFPTKEDVNQQPMPHILLTVGENFRKCLTENGHYEIPVESFAALRFFHPAIDNKYIVMQPNLQILSRILYAFPVHIEQYAEIIDDLITVFKDSGVVVDLKLHPLYRLKDIKGAFKLPDNFRISANVDTDSLRDTYDCVLFNDNSFGIEALLRGVKSFQYSREGDFIDDRFFYFNLWQVNYQLDDLYKLKDAIQRKNFEKEFDCDSVSAYVNNMYRPYSNAACERFQTIINSNLLFKN